MRFSNPSKKRFTVNFFWHLGLAAYVLFLCAYASGVMIFGVEFDNYWAVGYFSCVVVFIFIRIALYLTPVDVLYTLFPPGSRLRIFYQAFFFTCGWVAFGLGIWMMARGIQSRQAWTGDSYFCAMTGAWMASKWAFFLTIPMYKLREDTLTADQWKLVKDSSDSDDSSRDPLLSSSLKKGERNAKHEPFVEATV
ncbi:hypothetical protein STCU_04537 [Strigomonas culicis]|uniref:Uncharacterized protein n=1 Tax=Strigomonas culicis TaxID=28005 RepID=S9VQT2_9TRYP|nr:hypothetical protein STCU_04537 [Strigomonas culicis]|eukprot:EPY29476.1 hypothetical protein STCU_04537 [Strigomonas culicis]